MKFRLEDCVQRGHHFAIVDEVDSILIDEARTPLIISGPSEESTDKYYKVNRIIPKLVRGEVIEGKEPGEKYTTGDYTVDEKHRSVGAHRRGRRQSARSCSASPTSTTREHRDEPPRAAGACKAHVLFQRDRDYVVKDGQVIIVDEFTGRLMPGRRWSDGLHQAVEAKEGVKIERENQTLATITFQNYFRMYKKLAGMTGTAETEAAEFQKIYNLDVVVIPTNRPLIRKENADIVYRTEEEKFRNAAKEIKERSREGPARAGGHHLGREVREALGHSEEDGRPARGAERQAPRARGLHRRAGRAQGRRHRLHQHGRPRHRHPARRQPRVHGQGRLPEGEGGGAAAGRPGDLHRGRAVLLLPAPGAASTGCRVRSGTSSSRASRQQCDREHDEVVAAGGLHIVGTERHESRRIDNQLRGRAGRQGDPGSSRFFLSLQDDLLRIFGGERMQNLMLRLGMEEDVPIESRLITKRIAAAQKAVEAQNFEARKHLLEYDDVMNKQRKAVYGMRRQLLEGSDQKERISDMVRGIVQSFLDMRCPENAASRHLGSTPPCAPTSSASSATRSTPPNLRRLSRAGDRGGHRRAAPAEVPGEGRRGRRGRHARRPSA